MKTQVSKPAVRSAEGVAFLRAAATGARDSKVRNPDDVARYFVGLPHRMLLALPNAILRPACEALVPGGYCYFLARTNYFDQVFLRALESEFQQFAVLGAGYDSRAYRFRDQLRGRPVYEVDLPGAQQRKQEILRQTGLADEAIRVTSDFAECKVNEALAAHGFDFTKKTLFILEGVSYYVDDNCVRHLLTLCAQCAPGSQIVFDYSLPSFLDGDFSSYGSREMANWLKRNNEPFKFGITTSDLRSFADSCQLTLVEALEPPEIISRQLLDSSGYPIGKPLGYLCFGLCEKD